jgi:transporter family-2 protein
VKQSRACSNFVFDETLTSLNFSKPKSDATQRKGVTMRGFSLVFSIFLGIILALHLSMNGKVGASIGNPRVGNALFWCIGAFTAVLIGATGWQPNALSGLRGINPWLLTAGALGACLVFAIAWLLPGVGARVMFISLIAGQVLGGMIISHFGWLGSPVQRTTPQNFIGAIIMLAGVALATYSK